MSESFKELLAAIDRVTDMLVDLKLRTSGILLKNPGMVQ